jgi:hypothetical protein
VFRGYVPTPADRAAQNIAALSLGTAWNGGSTTDLTRFLSEAERAAAIHGREEIVVRVTQPPRALLLETDIPPHAYQLAEQSRLNSPTTGEGHFARRDAGHAGGVPAAVSALLDLGDRLRAGSLKFLILYREGEAEGWTVERLDRWEAIDGKFVSLVQEGWMIWSGAAFCFDCAPEEFKRNVVAKLGFIGSREKGWTELGIKTFLRHPEIQEVQPLRREIRERIAGRL